MRTPEAMPPACWSLPLRLLHWGVAALVLGLLALGFVMTNAQFDLPTSFTLYQWHKWIGLLVLALWLPRLAARAMSGRPPETAGWEGRVARLVHATFYMLLLAMPLTGWLATSASPLHLPLMVPLPFLGLVPMPELIRPDPASYAVLSGLHEIFAFVLTALVVLHVAGTIKHVAVDHDGTLRRMIG
ncbi:cytochrome b [Xanthobacter autotrophicus DSM 431]|uniref:cytochrome b n=1 Tax=Xanthobacter nonsaccharivorans TaxID=3119912 RepID=UPI00372A5494